MTMKDGKRAETARKARLAEKLRENLRRRKTQMRNRKEMETDELARPQADPPSSAEEPDSG